MTHHSFLITRHSSLSGYLHRKSEVPAETDTLLIARPMPKRRLPYARKKGITVIE
jgi:hypothetical protein